MSLPKALALLNDVVAAVMGRFPNAVVEWWARGDTSIAVFRSSAERAVQIIVSAHPDGSTQVEAGGSDSSPPPYHVEFLSRQLDKADPAREIAEVVQIAEQGLVVVRRNPMLGRLSESWVGPPEDERVVSALKRHRRARVVRGWDRWTV